jgi:predicted nucleic acid-binding protein
MPANDRFFVDSNVLLYSVDASVPVKRRQARRWLAALWESGAGRLSWQVLQEFYLSAERKTGLASTAARRLVAALAQWQPVGMSLGVIERSWYWMDKTQVHFWDGLILASAERAGCVWLLSADFQAGQKFGDLTIVSPFRTTPEELGLG